MNAGWWAVARKLQDNTRKMSYEEIFDFLIHDSETGEYTGGLDVPAGRYGKSGRDCAKVAAACAVAEGVDTWGERPTQQYLMYLTVNSSDDIGYILSSHGLCVSGTCR